jgi:hypothetical protein
LDAVLVGAKFTAIEDVEDLVALVDEGCPVNDQ